MTHHLNHPRDPRQAVCGLLAPDLRRWISGQPLDTEQTCEDCLTLLPDDGRPDDAKHPPGDPTLIDTLRRVVADRQLAKIKGVLVDLWSASVTVAIWARCATTSGNACSHCRRTR